jgi:hypothetical protein
MVVGCAEEVLISKTNVDAWILTIDIAAPGPRLGYAVICYI